MRQMLRGVVRPSAEIVHAKYKRGEKWKAGGAGSVADLLMSGAAQISPAEILHQQSIKYSKYRRYRGMLREALNQVFENARAALNRE